jgi:invasion protein IalB
MRVQIVVAAVMGLFVTAAVAQERSIEETVGDWQVLCFDDEVAQYRSCYVIRGDLLVFVGNGAERKPGSDVTAQVDGKKVLTWQEDNFYADDIFAEAIKEFRAGQKVKVSWDNKETDQKVTSEVSLIGFTKAYKRANTLISEYKPPE